MHTSILARLFGVLVCVLVACGPAAAFEDLKPEELYSRSAPSVVTLRVETKDGKGGTGSGFLAIKEGVVVTAWHVVRDAKKVTARFANGEEFEVSGLIDRDEKRDVALARIKVAARPLLTCESSDALVGAHAYVIGAPKGLEFSISDGLVSQLRTVEGTKLLQFTCPASPGNSGGPVINAQGKVIGVVSFQFRDGQNLNFAIPAVYALGLDASLPTQPWEAVKPSTPTEASVTDTKEIDAILAKAVIAHSDSTVMCSVTIDLIVRRSGGYRAGVPTTLYTVERDLKNALGLLDTIHPEDEARKKVYDSLVNLCPAALERQSLLSRAILLAQSSGGWYAAATDLLKRSEAAVRPEPSFNENIYALYKSSKTFRDQFPPHYESLLNQSSDYYAFKLGTYSFIRNPLLLPVVGKDGLADKLGFKDGDRVRSANGKTLTDLAELKTVIKNSLGQTLEIEVERDGKTKTLKVEVPKSLDKYR